MTRFLCAGLCLMALLTLSPHVARAQGYDGVMPAQNSYRPPAGTPATPQSNANVDDYSDRTDHGYSGSGGVSYDQMFQAQGSPAAQGLTGDALQDKIRAKREEMVRKLKTHSDQVLKQQKQRAWQQAHPGQPYPDANADNPDNYTDDGSANYDTPDADPSAQDNGPPDVGPGGGGNDGGDSDDVRGSSLDAGGGADQ